MMFSGFTVMTGPRWSKPREHLDFRGSFLAIVRLRCRGMGARTGLLAPLMLA